MNMQKVLAKLKKEYLSDLPQKIKDIEMSYKNHDIEELKSAFHKLKGSGTTYGVESISNLSRILEDTCIKHPNKIDQNIIDLTLSLMSDIGAEKIQSPIDLNEDPRFQNLIHILQKGGIAP